MRKALASLVVLPLALFATPSLARGGEVQITGFAGYTYPFYSQTLGYDLGPVVVPLPAGITLSAEEAGQFRLKASGSAAFGAAVAFFPIDTVGFELRVDRAGMKVKAEDATFDVNLTLPPPLSPLQQTITLTNGEASVDAPRPFSLNLKVRSAGHSRVFASGGLSRLGDLGFSLRQGVSLGVVKVNLQTQNLEVLNIDLHASRKAATTGGNWGGNLGLGFEIGLGDHGALVLEGRGFYFPKQTADWDAIVDVQLTDVQKQLLARLLERLPSVEFRPWWVQGTVGVAYRF